ncbi:MAG TPA: DUF4198 domain-containing protein [Phycisphaerales bacterium]|nr:DUF4198 domain-containing protein [Phycisphaerales bacterium]
MLRTALRSCRRLAGPLALGAIASAAGAHEFWVMPSAFAAQPGGLIRVELYHGERFAGDLVARDDAKIRRFEVVWPGAEPEAPAEVRGMHGAGASFVRPANAGRGVIVYETGEYINLLPAERFEAYLREEGLGEISRRRAELGETGAPGREAYVRCAKALVVVGPGGEGGGAAPDAPVGLPLEIVLEQGAGAPASGPVVASVLFEGRPLAGLRVVAVHEASTGELVELATDAEGRISFPAAASGAWMLTTIYMTRTDGREDVDWKSYWASLTFARPDGATTQPRAQALPHESATESARAAQAVRRTGT